MPGNTGWFSTGAGAAFAGAGLNPLNIQDPLNIQNAPQPVAAMQQEQPTLKSKSEYSRSSESPQDQAYQIARSLASLDQELGEALSAKEELATRLEALEESYTVIQSRISSLRKAANLLETSLSTGNLKRPQMTAPVLAGVGLGIPQAGLGFGAGALQAELEPWPPGQE